MPDVALIIKYNFPKDAGYYQKGVRKTTPVNENDVLYQIKMFLPFIQIGLFVISAVLFSGARRSHDSSQIIGGINYADGQVELVLVNQDESGPYAELKIFNSHDELVESITIRAGEAMPEVDSIKGKDIFVSYPDFPCGDSILPYDRILLGESLIEKDRLKFNYHFRIIK